MKSTVLKSAKKSLEGHEKYLYLVLEKSWRPWKVLKKSLEGHEMYLKSAWNHLKAMKNHLKAMKSKILEINWNFYKRSEGKWP